MQREIRLGTFHHQQDHGPARKIPRSTYNYETELEYFKVLGGDSIEWHINESPSSLKLLEI